MVVRDVGGRRHWAPNTNDAWSPWESPATSGELDSAAVTTGLDRRVSSLLSDALRADDAEASGFDARTLVADPARAVDLLGSPEVPPAARHCVVQRFGGVGALIVMACEDCWKRCHRAESTAGATRDELEPFQVDLRRLLELFTELGAEEMVELVREIENAACDSPVGRGDEDSQADAEARRWLHVTYAVAARDGTDEAHRAYVNALDRVLALKRELSFA